MQDLTSLFLGCSSLLVGEIKPLLEIFEEGTGSLETGASNYIVQSSSSNSALTEITSL